jgi:hypothetical protein
MATKPANKWERRELLAEARRLRRCAELLARISLVGLLASAVLGLLCSWVSPLAVGVPIACFAGLAGHLSFRAGQRFEQAMTLRRPLTG